VVFNISTRYRVRDRYPLAISCAVAFCDILMLRHCCRMRQSHIANSQNENSQIATFFHNENSHNATTSHYGICCTMRQRLNMRIVAYCDNTPLTHCIADWSYKIGPILESSSKSRKQSNPYQHINTPTKALRINSRASQGMP